MPPPAAAAGSARVFVALWPDHRVRQAVVRWRSRWQWPPSARLVAPRELHITLHFVGALPREALPALAAALAWRGAPFELNLGPAQQWAGGLALLGVDDAPPALFDLHAGIADALHACALRTEARRFAPHVTLARRAAGARPPARPLRCRWAVRDFVLVESGGPRGPGYHVLQRYAAAQLSAPGRELALKRRRGTMRWTDAS